MAKFDKFSSVFDENQGQNPDREKTPFQSLDVTQQSLAIVKAIDKLKAQGIPITKKAELDYLLAMQVLAKANIDPSSPLQTTQKTPETDFPDEDEPDESPANAAAAPVKRNPQDNPEEFEVALEFSRDTVAEVESLLQQGKSVPVKKLEEYELCKKFLRKYT